MMVIHNKRKTDELWYRHPAERWIEALPVGNGRLGGMVFGGVNRDMLQLNEETIWAGGFQDRNNHKGGSALKEIQNLLFCNEIDKASDLAKQTMVADPIRFDSYQMLGDLTVQMLDTIEYVDYRRHLDIANAIAGSSFKSSHGTSYRREYFCSAADQVLVARYESDQSEQLSFSISLTRVRDAISQKVSEDTIGLLGKCEGEGVSFCGAVKILCEGGSLRINNRRRTGNEITATVTKADRVTLLVTAFSDYSTPDYQAKCHETLMKACVKGFKTLRNDHIDEYRSYYDRFKIELTGNESENNEEEREETTFEWLKKIRNGNLDPEFISLFVNYNRYLLISSSRPGCLPSNLQGVWNDQLWAPFESDYHTNINLQMNYWPVEAFNLEECHTPLFDWMKMIEKHGSLTAEALYKARGWVVHHASDIWGSTGAFVGTFGIWPMGAAWLCRHLYEHYCYNMDISFLKNVAYPLIRGSLRFLLDFLVKAPEGTVCPGKLVCCPSHSPENSFITEDGQTGLITYGSTMDTEIIHDIGTICLEIIDILSADREEFESTFKKEIMDALDLLPPILVSKQTGGIQEWAQDFNEKSPDHRHVSHLYGIYPGKMITMKNNPDLSKAAGRSIDWKFMNGYDGQGWSLSWIACIWARLQEPERAYNALENIFTNHILHNLFINAHGIPQVGDAQGVSAAVLEMLAQSHAGEIVLLPSLPGIWKQGTISGMRLRGGYTLDMIWKDGSLVTAKLNAKNVRNPLPVIVQNAEKNKKYKVIYEGELIIVVPA